MMGSRSADAEVCGPRSSPVVLPPAGKRALLPKSPLEAPFGPGTAYLALDGRITNPCRNVARRGSL